jgi:hypothetical protein
MEQQTSQDSDGNRVAKTVAYSTCFANKFFLGKYSSETPVKTLAKLTTVIGCVQKSGEVYNIVSLHNCSYAISSVSNFDFGCMSLSTRGQLELKLLSIPENMCVKA